MQLHLTLRSAEGIVHEIKSSRNVVVIEKVDRALILSFSDSDVRIVCSLDLREIIYYDHSSMELVQGYVQ